MADFNAKLRAYLDRWETLKGKEGEPDDMLAQEFSALKTESLAYKEQNTYPAESGQLPVNKKKNRFKDILPFEYTRVQLHSIEGVEGSDYINANYIQGYDGNVTYIASQGPLPHTVNDFWRMIWYHQIEIVVMACREVEMGKMKCQTYWPGVGESQFFGAIKVTTKHEENISNDFIIRELVAECQGEEQVVRQYHYTAWPDHGRPQSPVPIIRMIEMLRHYRKRQDIPVVVHCSAGCGRTGTILAIDLARSMMLSKDIPAELNLFNIVREMRKQRPAMVQAKDQYFFVYLAVAEIATRLLDNTPQAPPKQLNFEKKALAPQPKSLAELSDGCGTYENWVANTSETTTEEAPEQNVAAGGGKVPPKVPTKPKAAPPLQPKPLSRNNSPGTAMMDSATDTPTPAPKPLPRSISPAVLDKEGKQTPPLLAPKPAPKPDSPAVQRKSDGSRPQPAPRASIKRKKESFEETPPVVPMKPVPAAPPTGSADEPVYSVVKTTPKDSSTPKKPDSKSNKSLNSTGSLSILETLMMECGDIDLEEEKPAVPPPVHAKPLPPVTESAYSLLGEVGGNTPPMIPRRTADSHGVGESTPEVMKRAGGGGGGMTEDGLYELAAPIAPSLAVTKEPSPPALPPTPNNKPPSSVFSIATMRSGQHHQLQEHSSSSKQGTVASIGKALKNIGKGKLSADDKKQSSSGIKHSSSDHNIRSSSPSTSPSKQSANLKLNSKYNFPGEMGFGVRISRPKGPRPMPSNWGLPNGLLH